MGPLEGVKIIEVAGIGPGPFCGMMLSDMGAEVLRIDRASNVRDADPEGSPPDALGRGRTSIAVDLRNPEGAEVILKLVEKADVIYEGFRPGVMERLGIGPDVCLARNPSIIYGRMTGWGQEGPMAHASGHDINYIALAGALEPLGRLGSAPTPPLNLVGDFGGGGMLLAFGIACALVERGKSGKGQVIDSAMVDGAAALMAMFAGQVARGQMGERGTNILDTGSHFYDAYETKEGKYISVGSIEPQFYAELLRLSGLDAEDDLPGQHDKARWPEMKGRISAIFKSKTRDEWRDIMEGTDVCFAPVLSPQEATEHPHNVHRNTFIEIGGFKQPAPAPRFDRTPTATPTAARHPGQDTDEALGKWGFSGDEIAKLRESGAVAGNG